MGILDCIKKVFKEEETVIERVPHRGIVSRVGGYNDIGIKFTLQGDHRVFYMHYAGSDSLMQKGDEVEFTICIKEEDGKRIQYFTNVTNLTMDAENYDFDQTLGQRL